MAKTKKTPKSKKQAYVPLRDLYYVQPKDMTLDECEREKENLELTFRMCREIQNGISTKDWMRYRLVCHRLEDAGRAVVWWS